MKWLIVCFLNCFFCNSLLSQNVGIGTMTPSERLDVNGNANFRNQIKVNGDSGKASQVLMKNAANNLVWGDLSEFKNISVLDCLDYASSAGANNCSFSWNVPAGVTTVLVECWGGGGGGGNFSAGGGGGYVSARLTATPGTAASIVIGAGGYYASSTADGIAGGNTVFTLGTAYLTAYGGAGGSSADISNPNSAGVAQSIGGTFLATGTTAGYIGYNGSPGGVSKVSYVQVAANDFGRQILYGDGGDAALLVGSGAKGGTRMISTNYNYQTFATTSGIQQGGGGAADGTFGYYGKGGRVIIRW